jgi:predicted amidophosphoribosyltransferase
MWWYLKSLISRHRLCPACRENRRVLDGLCLSCQARRTWIRPAA